MAIGWKMAAEPVGVTIGGKVSACKIMGDLFRRPAAEYPLVGEGIFRDGPYGEQLDFVR